MRPVTDRAQQLAHRIVWEAINRGVAAGERNRDHPAIPAWGGPSGAQALAANLLLCSTAPRWPGFHPGGVHEGASRPREVAALAGLNDAITQQFDKSADLDEAYALAAATILTDVTMRASFFRGFGVSLYYDDKQIGFGFLDHAAGDPPRLALAISGSLNAGKESDWTGGRTRERAEALGVTRKLSFRAELGDTPFSAAVLESF